MVSPFFEIGRDLQDGAASGVRGGAEKKVAPFRPMFNHADSHAIRDFDGHVVDATSEKSSSTEHSSGVQLHPIQFPAAGDANACAKIGPGCSIGGEFKVGD